MKEMLVRCPGFCDWEESGKKFRDIKGVSGMSVSWDPDWNCEGILEFEWRTVADQRKALLGSARQILTQRLSESQLPRLLQGDCHTELRQAWSVTCSEPVSACCFLLLMMVERKVIVILIFIIIRDWVLAIYCATGTAVLVKESGKSYDPQIDGVAWLDKYMCISTEGGHFTNS